MLKIRNDLEERREPESFSCLGLDEMLLARCAASFPQTVAARLWRCEPTFPLGAVRTSELEWKGKAGSDIPGTRVCLFEV